MTKKFLVPIDMAQNPTNGFVFENLASAPSGPIAGRAYYDTGVGKWFYRNASAWIDPLARANHTGTQLAATISDFDTQVRTSRLDQMASPTTALSINSQRLINVADPSGAQDAATKNYVDALINGTDWKNSVRGTTTANDSLSGLAARDGVTPVAGDRWLVKDQTTQSANGLYVAASGAWTRSTDADTSAKVTADLAVFVEEGTLYSDTQWRLTTNNPITLGTTSLTFAQIGAGSSYTGGTGISVAGSVISLDTAVAVRKFAATVGDGTSTSIAVTHSLGTLDVQVQVIEIATGALIECDQVRNSTSQVTVSFTVAPASNTMRVLVQG